MFENFIAAGVLVDEDCFENAQVTLKSNGETIASQQTNFCDFKLMVSIMTIPSRHRCRW